MRHRSLATIAASIIVAAAGSSSATAQSVSQAVAGIQPPQTVVADSTRPRPKAIEYSDAYATRLTIHRIGSYTMLPLFASEYFLGDRLMRSNAPDWIKPTHVVVASGIGVLFLVNTVTGVWNLAESRKDPTGRARRILHSALMIAAEAGFAYTAAIASDDSESDEFESEGFGSSDDRTKHKNAALVSMGISTVGTMMMWLWKD